jgi:hypothetical protein
MTERIQSTEPLVTECDCGHTVTAEGIGTGYATDPITDRRICYDCAAQVDREYAKTMKPSDPPLFAYIRKAPVYPSDTRIEITNWPGRKLGYGYMGPRQDVLGGPMQSVSAIIEGREFHGRHYPDAGDYVRLRPYKNQPA